MTSLTWQPSSASELKIMAEWLGLGTVEILPRGDLASALAAL